MRPVIIHAAWSPGEVRVAAAINSVLVDYTLWRPGSPDGVGDVHGGRVTAIVPAMAGAFVALAANGEAEGFLPDSDGAKGLTEGTAVMVRVTRAAQGGKGPRLSARLDTDRDAPTGGLTGLLRRGVDPLRELAARYPAAEVFVDDPTLAASLRADLGDRVTRVAEAFDDAIETEVDRLTAAEITLPSGARFSVWPTPALVAIDVDGGSALAGRARGNAPRAHLGLNAAMIPELARQIRLRNLSGAIFIDLAGMKAKRRAALGPALSAALVSDPLRPRFLGFTVLGLAEITRPRVRPPLHEALSGPLAAGLAALRAIARSTRAEPGRRLLLRAAPAVIAAVEADSVATADIARITGQRLNSRSDPSLTGDGWSVEAANG
jgi:Ribonuclease G/E